ncbi:MAG: NADP-dependent malic enzyme [Candidatus Woesearchaeota archaeon]
MSEVLEKHNGGMLDIASKMPIKNQQDLSIAYTPGVAEVCKTIAKDKELVFDYTIKKNTVAVVTDGSAVLGLGNIGPEAAIPVMEGKCMLFKEFAGINAFPIALATQEPEEIISHVKSIAPVFGGINLEDISAPRCFEIEERLKAELDIPVFHDDQHGTAIVVLAGIMNSLILTKREIGDTRFIINGAGAAGIAIAKLLILEGAKEIIMLDSKGAIYKGRDSLNKYKEEIAEKTNLSGKKGLLKDIIPEADVFIGVSKGNILTGEDIKSMNKRPVIFALANPEPEIEPGLAYEAGAAVVATGRSDYPNQVNNVLAFPGLFKAVLETRTRDITDGMKQAAAYGLARAVREPVFDHIIPGPFEEGVAEIVAESVNSFIKNQKFK